MREDDAVTDRRHRLWPCRIGAALAALHVLAGLSACEDGGHGPGVSTGVEITVIDSAGVQLVHSSLDPGAPPAIPIREELRIGSVEGPEATQFHLIRSVATGPGDEIFVALLGSNEIRVFGPDGAYRRTVGRPGEGPGEFGGLSTVHLRGDTLVALDMRLVRTATFLTDGRLLSTATVPRGESGLLTPLAPFSDGWVVSLPHPAEWPAHGRSVERWGTAVIVVGTPDVGEAMARVEAVSGRLPPLGEPPYPLPVVELAGGRRFGMDMGGVSTGQTPLWEPSQRMSSDAGGRLYVTGGAEYRIDVYDAAGRLVRRLARSHRPVPLTDAMKARYLDHVRAHYDTTEAVTEFGTDPVEPHQFRVGLPMANHLPPTGRIVASGEGRLLVERPDLVDDPVALEWTALGPQPSHWDLYDEEGAFVGTVTFPERFSPRELSPGWVLGVHRDDLGVEYVVRFALG